MADVGPRRLDKAVALALCLMFGALAYARYEPYTFLHGDGAFYANINKSILRDASLDQTKYHPHSWFERGSVAQDWSNVSLGKDGRWYPKHSYVLPLLSTPLYALLGLDGLLLFHVAMLVLLLFAAYRVAAHLVPAPVAAMAALTVAAQAVVLDDVYSYNNDVFYAAVLVAGVAAFLSRRPALGGALLGLGVFAKVTNLAFVAPFAIWLLARRDVRETSRALIAFAIPVALFAAGNQAMFGSPLETSYQRILVRKGGKVTTESVSERFKDPLGAGLERVALDPGQGLRTKAPLLGLAALAALVLLAFGGSPAARPLGACFLAVLAAFLAIQAKYQYTYARFFLPVVGLSVAPIAAALDLSRRRWVVPLARRLQARLGSGGRGWIVPGALAGLAGGVLAATALSRGHKDVRLSDRVESAVVTNGRARCDYFNNQHQKWECPGESKDFMWGLSLGSQCTLDGRPHRMLWLHPPASGEKRMAFEDLPPGHMLEVGYGLAETSKHPDVRVELILDGARLQLPPIRARGALQRERIPLPNGLKRLEIAVRGPPTHWRHLCLDATLQP